MGRLLDGRLGRAMSDVKHEKVPLDISRYLSKDDGLRAVDEVGDSLAEVGRMIVSTTAEGVTFLHAFAISASVRATGLHRAIRSAIADNNPHAVFPLLRSYVETAMVICYLTDRPSEVRSFLGLPESDPASRLRPSSQKLIDHAARRYSGIKALWAELSDLTHLGSPAVWMPWVIEDEQQRLTTIASFPRWRRPQEALIACGEAVEIGDVVVQELNRLREAHLEKVPGSSEVVAQTAFVSIRPESPKS